MTIADDRVALEFRSLLDDDRELERLLESAAELSYDPEEEVDWDAPVDPTKYGLNPEWSTLYGTKLWDEMSEEQRITLTRHEVGSIMSTGIWFEGMLKHMILRTQYDNDYGSPEFKFALVEIADECRHSIMFSKACTKLGVPHYRPIRFFHELARGFKVLCNGEQAYGAILVAEEILDVMQRDWMRGENVLDEVRTTSKIHVLEEARHMKFARMEIIDYMKKRSFATRWFSGVAISIVANVIVRSLVNSKVYKNSGLDEKRAIAEAKANVHYRNLMRMSCIHLMDFLSEAGLLNRVSMTFYRAVNML